MVPVRSFFLFMVTVLLSVGSAIGQGSPSANISVAGKVIDAVDSTPVQAKITLESLPDNTDVHIVQASDSTGIFFVNLHQHTDYSILVDAPYYKPEMDTLSAETLGKFDLLYRLLPVRLGHVLQLQKIYFSPGGYNILQSSYGELTELLYLFNEYPDLEVRLEGHTDRLGGSKNNMILSEKRVEAIRDYLVAHGISEKRIKVKGYGDTRPVSTENTEAARRANRRVEVRILKI